MTPAVHKRAEALNGLISLASAVMQSAPCGSGTLSAREAARALAGVVSWVAHHSGTAVMHDTMTALAMHTDAWRVGSSILRTLPVDCEGEIDSNVALVAVVASGLVHAFGAPNLRAAMAYWATERDPGSWQKVIEA